MTCTGPGPCKRPVLALSLCSSHYAQHRRGRDLSPIRARTLPRNRITVRVDDATLERLAKYGHPATMASEVLYLWRVRSVLKNDKFP